MRRAIIAVVLVTSGPGFAATTSAPPSTSGLILRLDTGALCGGTLVAQDTVLTAAHCVADLAAGPGSLRVLLPGEQGNRVLHQVAHTIMDEAYVREDGIPGLDHIGRDIAIVRLTEPASGQPARIGGPVRQAAHVGFFQGGLQTVTPPTTCPLDLSLERPLVLHCPARPGMSGMPVFAFDRGAPELVGVISAAGLRGTTVVTYVAPIAGQGPWLERALPGP